MTLETGAEALIAAISIEIGKLVVKFLKNKGKDNDPKWKIKRKKKERKK